MTKLQENQINQINDQSIKSTDQLIRLYQLIMKSVTQPINYHRIYGNKKSKK